jgi:predicted nuclease of restriction endonuclease-like RecB superfamily
LDDNRKVYVSLSREDIAIAVEISVTNTVEYEVQNINKCLEADYHAVLVISEDERHLAKIQSAFTGTKAQISMVKFLN